MNLRRTYAVVLRQYYLLVASPPRIIQIFVWAVVDVILWGFITKYLSAVGGEFNFVSVLLGAVLLWDFLVRVQQGVTMPFLEDSWARNFLNMFASPLRVNEYVSGLVVTSMFTSFIGLAAMLSIAFLAFGFSLFNLGLMLVPFILILFLFGCTLGVFGSALVLRFGPSAEWFTWPLPFMLSPFVGVFYPISVLPVWMQWIAGFLPPTYVFAGMRDAILNDVFSYDALVLGILLGVGFLLASYAFFVLTHRKVVRNGAIARYSAEVL
jgi:ABC-2 type transport system permease protein